MLRGSAAIALALSASACAISPYSNVTAFAERTNANSFESSDRAEISAEALVLPVVHDQQVEGASCGAHALASVVNYWRRSPALTGREIFHASPPANEAGYSMAELVDLAQAQGLLASAVRLPADAIIQELERGRPVLVPVRLPVSYIQRRALPGAHLPLIGTMGKAVLSRASRLSGLGSHGMVDHYLLVVGYEGDTLVVVEPVLGYRTISNARLAGYRSAFGDAAIVFSSRSLSR